MKEIAILAVSAAVGIGGALILASRFKDRCIP